MALWTSFIAAGVETMIVFAFLDPATLGFEGLAPSLAALRPTLYAVGFFFFWSFNFIAAALTAYMIESGPRNEVPATNSAPGQSPDAADTGASTRAPVKS